MVLETKLLKNKSQRIASIAMFSVLSIVLDSIITPGFSAGVWVDRRAVGGWESGHLHGRRDDPGHGAERFHHLEPSFLHVDGRG